MKTQENVELLLSEFSERFIHLIQKYDGTIHHSVELERTIDQYSAFITNEANTEAWEQIILNESGDMDQLVADLRRHSARCVGIMEKYRALKLLSGNTEMTDYFQNIESCIEEEFGGFRLTAESKVLMIGSGAFPMTPLYIAKQTGASVVGIDIDDEAVELGRRVVERLGSGLPIMLAKIFVENLEYTKNATHIIFSSTVESKYDLLDQLYSLTNEQAVVAMRYGDQLKSLFNYPMKDVDERKWRLAEVIIRPEHVFDIALYAKV
ncbi:MULTISPECIES: SAM-dependent methyltransferase [Paenibacillus]|uniref:SAM-dependent methyltransferase n=1 Tax=Paenibacillus TaxID=44249 RepID=UPI0022B8DC9D|nr:SAM-dependent methyltransferase [Paenibacillus caseinilyticus]MCZ8521261.1 SAM-dependent methyltransferase [Paenibacillus caseinilyticus]